MVESGPQCWCGNTNLVPYAPEYLRCSVCETLVSMRAPNLYVTKIEDEDQDLYGRNYWFEHQEHDLKSINIVDRARTDLPERCVYWLSILLRYTLPPGRALELGCGHGGFVALLQWLGYQAQGLELSPWIVEFARRIFEIPVLLGRIEDQKMAAESLDLVILIDVLEHLASPVQTLQRCVDLLSPAGILFVQTPCFPHEKTYQELLDQQDVFLKMLIPDEHVYLFSRPAIERLFAQLHIEHMQYEPAMASHDMIYVASRHALATISAADRQRVLTETASARLVGALLDKERVVRDLMRHLNAKEHELVALRRWASHKDRDSSEYLQALEQRLASAEHYAFTLREVLSARDVEVANAAAYIASLRTVLEAREKELRNSSKPSPPNSGG